MMTIPPPPWRTQPPKARGPRREPLTQDRIVEVALELLRTEGYEAVTMRRLALELGTGPASLYAHVENRRELDQLIVDRVIDESLIPDPDPEHWEDQVKDVMRRIRAMYQRHPGVARATMAMVPTGPSALMTIERMLRILLAGGVPPQLAAWACDLIPLYVGAVSFEESLWSSDVAGIDEREYFVAQLRDYLKSLPTESFPTVVALAAVLTTGDGEDRFEFGIDVLVSGLAAVARRQQAAAADAAKTT
jgi:AcrR family transcriptional regulator